MCSGFVTLPRRGRMQGAVHRMQGRGGVWTGAPYLQRRDRSGRKALSRWLGAGVGRGRVAMQGRIQEAEATVQRRTAAQMLCQLWEERGLRRGRKVQWHLSAVGVRLSAVMLLDDWAQGQVCRACHKGAAQCVHPCMLLGGRTMCSSMHAIGRTHDVLDHACLLMSLCRIDRWHGCAHLYDSNLFTCTRQACLW